MMKSKAAVICALAAVIAIAPLSPASAHDRWHGGPLFGLFALGAAAVVGTAAILTAPINAIAAAPPQAYYAPPPQYYAQQRVVYAAPPPVYYQQAPVYYTPQRVIYAAPPAAYYQQGPVYYR